MLATKSVHLRLSLLPKIVAGGTVSQVCIHVFTEPLVLNLNGKISINTNNNTNATGSSTSSSAMCETLVLI